MIYARPRCFYLNVAFKQIEYKISCFDRVRWPSRGEITGKELWAIPPF
jgi:hypothetical protein